MVDSFTIKKANVNLLELGHIIDKFTVSKHCKIPELDHSLDRKTVCWEQTTELS